MNENSENNSLETLEDPSTKTGNTQTVTPDNAPDTASLDSDSSGNGKLGGANQGQEPVNKSFKKSLRRRISGLISRLNIYLLLFILIVVLAVGLVLVGIARNKKTSTVANIANQSLTADQLNNIKGSDATVGDSKQTLTIQSNAIFNNAVLVKGSLDVAGAIKVGGALNLPGITVSGASSFDQITANKLSIAGDTNIQGQLSIQKTLTVTGATTFGGPVSASQLTLQNLQLNGDLQINKHLVAAGSTPSKNDGGSIGNGGTTSVSGSDTAGTLTINFGGGASANGCYININFTSRFPATPSIIISPTSASAAQLKYYTQPSTSGFQVCSTGGSASGSASFSYFVIE